VALTARWTVSLVLAVQIATVWLALRTSRARRFARVSAGVLLAVAAAVAVANLVASDDASGFPLVFVASASCT
jgi:hypothetical protein